VLDLVLAAAPIAAQAARPTEYQVKAAFLYNFAKFVEWPSGAFDGPSSPLVICIAGEDPFGNFLTGIVAGKTINGRRLIVERRSETADFRSCHIVFAGVAEKKRLPQILDSLKGAAVLTVGETDRFAQEGGIVDFYLDQDRVRFEINVAASTRCRLKISSKLLALARIVGGDSREANY
jgi:hypothetical protein